MHSAQPVRLALFPSGRLAALVLLLHGTAALCFLTVLTGWSGIALALLILALGVSAAWDRALLRGGRSPRAIEIRPSGEAVCLFADGASAVVQAVRGSGISRYWVALRLDLPRRRSLLLAAGMLPPEPFRLLRLWALWGKLPAVAWRQLPGGP